MRTEDWNEFITVIFEHSVFFKENGFMLDKVTSNPVYDCRASPVTRTHLHIMCTELAANQSFHKTCISSSSPAYVRKLIASISSDSIVSNMTPCNNFARTEDQEVAKLVILFSKFTFSLIINLMIILTNFRGDLTDTSAKTATLG